jgi:hypothetical protein
MDVVLVTVQLALSIALPWWVIRRDMRRLPPQQLERTWNDASFWSAVVVFNWLSIPVHFTKARRSPGGCLLGVLWMLAVLAVSVGVALGLTAVAG